MLGIDCTQKGTLDMKDQGVFETLGRFAHCCHVCVLFKYALIIIWHPNSLSNTMIHRWQKGAIPTRYAVGQDGPENR